MRGVIIDCRAIHASPTQVIFNGSGERVRPHSTSPFRLPRLPNQPRVLLVLGGVDLPASARAPRPAATTPRRWIDQHVVPLPLLPGEKKA